MIRLFAIGALVVVLGFGVWYFRGPLLGTPAYSLTHIDISDTEEERVQGLSGRATLPEDYGMLFIFPVSGNYGFWMKDMLIPIDIVWLSETGSIVGIDANVATSTFPKEFHPPMPVRYVLETRAGLLQEKGWAVGTILSLPIR